MTAKELTYILIHIDMETETLKQLKKIEKKQTKEIKEHVNNKDIHFETVTIELEKRTKTQDHIIETKAAIRTYQQIINDYKKKQRRKFEIEELKNND